MISLATLARPALEREWGPLPTGNGRQPEVVVEDPAMHGGRRRLFALIAGLILAPIAKPGRISGSRV